MKRLTHVATSLLLLLFVKGRAQISPPGLGKGHTADWLALGFRQKLNRRNTWQWMSYVGIGRKSDPDNFNPVRKPAILVLNEELSHRVGKHYQYSFAISYRRQDEYLDLPPYQHQSKAIQQEFRAYARGYYFLPLGSRYKLALVSRQEIRKFYTTDFREPAENAQFRSRWRMQATMNLNKEKTQKLIAGAEALWATAHVTGTNRFSALEYTESRFTLYYSRRLRKLPLTVDLGYMNNLLAKGARQMVHYLGVDIIWENPF